MHVCYLWQESFGFREGVSFSDIFFYLLLGFIAAERKGKSTGMAFIGLGLYEPFRFLIGESFFGFFGFFCLGH